MVYFSKRLPSGCSHCLIQYLPPQSVTFSYFSFGFLLKLRTHVFACNGPLCIHFLIAEIQNIFQNSYFPNCHLQDENDSKISLSYAFFGRLERWKNLGYSRLITFAICSLLLFYVSILYTIKIKII